MVCVTQRLPDTESWPFHPLLPVRHLRETEFGMPKLGIIVDGSRMGLDGWETTVYHAMLGTFKNVRELVTKKKSTYGSQEALLQDWIVD